MTFYTIIMASIFLMASHFACYLCGKKRERERGARKVVYIYRNPMRPYWLPDKNLGDTPNHRRF